MTLAEWTKVMGTRVGLRPVRSSPIRRSRHECTLMERTCGGRISTLSTLVYSSLLYRYLIVHLSATLAAILFKLPKAKSSTSVIWK